MYMCVCVNVSLCLWLPWYICEYFCFSVYPHGSVCVCVEVPGCVRVRVCVRICVCLHAWILECMSVCACSCI